MPTSDERRYQVFVSSTFTDLEDERQHALQAILEMRCFPAGMELFPSADEEQFEFIKREIESSDYYIVILAGKYGSVAEDGLSFTEKEYDYAVSINKPVMAFIFRDLEELKGGQLEMDDGEKRSKLEAFRAKARAKKLVRFYKNSDDLKAQILQALNRATQFHPAEGWVRAKNARRLEDLEEINTLTKQVSALTVELNNLKSASVDPHSFLEQGDDTLEVNLTLREQPTPGKAITTVPVAFSTTWNYILGRLFAGGHSYINAGMAESTLHLLVKERAIGAHLINEADTDRFTVDAAEFTVFMTKLGIQFSGLGYIEVDRVQSGSSRWVLSQKGKLHVALVVGAKRKPPKS